LPPAAIAPEAPPPALQGRGRANVDDLHGGAALEGGDLDRVARNVCGVEEGGTRRLGSLDRVARNVCGVEEGGTRRLGSS